MKKFGILFLTILSLLLVTGCSNDKAKENKKDEGLEFGKKIFGDFLTVKEE